MRRRRLTVAAQFTRASTSDRPPFVYELHDGDRDGAEEEHVYEPLLPQNELPREPRREEHGG